jgi:hypothetical protein
MGAMETRLQEYGEICPDHRVDAGISFSRRRSDHGENRDFERLCGLREKSLRDLERSEVTAEITVNVTRVE